MTSQNETQPAAEDLDETSLDLVVGGVVVHDATGDTSTLRKQEESLKVA
jgi:hypothetical protein